MMIDLSLQLASKHQIEVGESNYNLVRIPPNIWYGFQGTSKNDALIANCTDMPFSENEVRRIASDSKEIPYQWGTP